MRRKVAKLKQKSRKADFKESDSNRDQPRTQLTWTPDTYHANADAAVKSTGQTARHSKFQQSGSPVPIILAVTPGAGPQESPQKETGIRLSHGTLGSKDSLGTSTPVLSPMMSPMMLAPDTQPGLMHTGFVIATPKSLLGSVPSSKKHDAPDFQGPGGKVDVLDIRGLNARVDAMQARLVYTIQQAKLARGKTRSAATGRRGQVRGRERRRVTSGPQALSLRVPDPISVGVARSQLLAISMCFVCRSFLFQPVPPRTLCRIKREAILQTRMPLQPRPKMSQLRVRLPPHPSLKQQVIEHY